MATPTAEGATHAPTASEYIRHHLGHLANHHQEGPVDFNVLHYDTIFWSIAMGVVGCLILWMAARKATSGVPGRFQAAVEMLVEMVEDQSKSIVHGDRRFIAPLALTVFVWVALMNSLDFLPVDLFSEAFKWFGVEHLFPYHRVVPTADLNGTIGISLGIAQQVVAALGEMGLGLGPQTMVLMTGMMMGAGIDYAVFLFSR